MRLRRVPVANYHIRYLCSELSVTDTMYLWCGVRLSHCGVVSYPPTGASQGDGSVNLSTYT